MRAAAALPVDAMALRGSAQLAGLVGFLQILRTWSR